VYLYGNMKARGMARIEISLELGACVRGLRERRRMTQAQLAKKLRTTIPIVSRIENGRRDLVVAELEALAAALGSKGSTVLRAAERAR
jgi:transcriptional regulator with XRE-family HTH domain